MIILVGGEKGGSGKSTLACNLAAMLNTFNSVCLIDTDIQQSASQWASYRAADKTLKPVDHMAMYGMSISQQLVNEKFLNKWDIFVIDAGGRDSVELRAAMSVADLIIIPIRASQPDFNTLAKMNSLLEQALVSRPAYMNPLYNLVILTQLIPTASLIDLPIYWEYIEQESKYLHTHRHVTYHRIDYQRSFTYGKSVIEYNKHSKANPAICNILACVERFLTTGVIT